MSDRVRPEDTAAILERIERLLREHDELRTRLEKARQGELQRDNTGIERRRGERRRADRRRA
jgi:hypothetical protein